jgi:DNA-binding transcriptional LysR family regulator
MLDVHRLRILREVARCGSFTAAARTLAYTPSAVSQQIAILEREVNVALLERGPRGVTLTEPGRVLVQRSEAVFSSLAAAESELRSLAGLNAGLLRLGWFATAGANLIPRAIAAFRQRHPGIKLDLFQGDPDECTPKLRSRELELALVYEFEPPQQGRALLDQPDLEFIDLFDDTLFIGLPLDHPLARRSRIHLADLANAQWIQGVRTGGTLDVLPRACRQAGFEPNIVLRTDDRTVVEGLVAAGVGVALVPQLTVPTARPDIAVRPLDGDVLYRRVFVAMASGQYRAPAATAMVDILRTVCADLITDANLRVDRRSNAVAREEEAGARRTR